MDFTSHLTRLDQLGCEYAFYFHPAGKAPFFQANCERFTSASIIKVPILLAWLSLERQGEVSREEICCLDDEIQVEGSGIARLFKARRLPFEDILLLMISLSDNLCTNLIIRRIGVERLARIFKDEFGFHGTEAQRRLMDLEARDRGLNNWVTAHDAIQFYHLIDRLTPEEKSFACKLLEACVDDGLLKYKLPRDTVRFYHKTGSMEHVLHDWGFAAGCELFLFTQNVPDEPAVFDVFGSLGRVLLEDPTNYYVNPD